LAKKKCQITVIWERGSKIAQTTDMIFERFLPVLKLLAYG